MRELPIGTKTKPLFNFFFVSVSSTASRSKMGQRPSSPLPTPPHSPEAVQFFGLLPPLPPSSLVTQSTPPRGCPVMPKKLPKRLNVAYFWARNRIVQKACMVRKRVYDYAVTEELGTILLTQLHCFRQRRTLSIFLVF